jgi:antirestriction protein ArdC
VFCDGLRAGGEASSACRRTSRCPDTIAPPSPTPSASCGDPVGSWPFPGAVTKSPGVKPGARADVYTRVTAEIIAAIEQGAGEWHAPWFHNGTSAARPTNVASGRRYRGINTVALWAAAMTDGYNDGLWGTYLRSVRRCARANARPPSCCGGQVASSDAADDDDDDDDNSSRVRMFAKAFSVFNVAQVDGYERPPTCLLSEDERMAQAETFIANLGIRTVFGGSEACYCSSSDTVFMPDFAAFRDAPSFYGVWLHENGHEPPRVYRRVKHSKDEPYVKAEIHPRLSGRASRTRCLAFPREPWRLCQRRGRLQGDRA